LAKACLWRCNSVSRWDGGKELTAVRKASA